MHLRKLPLVGLLVALLVPPFLASAATSLPANGSLDRTFSQQDLTALTQPGVVRIIHHISGTVVVHPFKIDFKTAKAYPAPAGKAREMPIDSYLSGTGFFVSPDGYILTNGHVVSDDFYRLSIAGKLYVLEAESEATRGSVSDKEAQKFADAATALTYAEHMEIRKELMSFIEFKNLSSTVTVLNPTQKGSQQVKMLVNGGFTAVVKQVGKGFPLSDDDVALIKITGSSFPAIPVASSSENIKTSDRVYTFGFPATADATQISLNSSFTDGSVSARKDSDDKSFSLIETNAKISEGSSGSPLLDSAGGVVGIVSMQSGDQTLGDNFGFAIPIEVSKQLFTKEGITPQPGAYDQSLREGLALSDERHCKKAIDAFTAAGQAVDPRIAVTNFLDPYIKTCNTMIANGASIDTTWDAIKDWLFNLGTRTWLVIGGAIVAIVVLSIIITMLVRRVRREDKEIDQLENMVMHDHFAKEAAALGAGGGTDILADVPPDLAVYVRQMTSAGASQESIKGELKKAGWDDAIINRAV
ncbi:MAG: S1C family serine protease [Minisyncoccota bacterium]